MFFTSLKEVVVKVKSRAKGRKAESSESQPSALIEELCRRFSLAELQSATNNFDHKSKFGEDEYGSIYKGFLNHGTSVVAISKLKSPRIKDEFQFQIQLLCQLRHQNLAPLIGFCLEKQERITVYEYMNCGSLASRIHTACADPLPWKQRLEICIGVASGLHYLHTGAKYAIIHRNINSANILFNKNCVARIVDFSFSKIGPHSMSKLKNVTCSPSVLSCLKYCVVDWLKGKIAPVSLIEFVEIAFSCIHPNPRERPSMGEVEVTLELALELQEKADSVMKAANPHGHYNCIFSLRGSPQLDLLVPTQNFSSPL